MNIHEHQAKQILKKYGAIVPEGIFALTVDELVEKAKTLNTKKYVLKVFWSEFKKCLTTFLCRLPFIIFS